MACLFGLVWFVNRYPYNILSRVLLSWNGPYPRNGEKQHKFTLRWSNYAFKWAVEILVVWCVIMWLNEWGIYGGEPIFITALLAFALPLGFMVALAGSVGLLVKAGWQRRFRSSYVFSEEEANFVQAHNK